MRRYFTVAMLMLLMASVAGAKEQTLPPEIDVEEGYDEWIIEAYGEGEVHLFKDGEEVENPYRIEVTEEYQYYHFEAYAQAEGCLPSEWVEKYVEIPGYPVPIIPVLPEYSFTITDEYVILELIYDEDEYTSVKLYGNGVPHDPPYMLSRWEESYEVDIVVDFYSGTYYMTTLSFVIVVPALEGAPHDVDGNGWININDVTTLIDYLLTLNPEGVNVDKSDVDGNGQININDVTELINRLLDWPEWW